MSCDELPDFDNVVGYVGESLAPVVNADAPKPMMFLLDPLCIVH